MINNFVIGKVVGTGSTLLLLARNKEQLEVKMEREPLPLADRHLLYVRKPRRWPEK